MAIDPKYKPIFTLVGLNKIANAINTGVKIELKSMALGDANGVDYTPTESLTALTHEVIRFNLRTLWYENITATNKTILKFTGILEPGLISSKTVREVGVYDNAGDLIIIFRIPDRQILSEGNIATMLDLTFGITLSNNSNIFMTLGENTGDFTTLTEYNGHVNNLMNPHGTTKAQILLGNVDNTADNVKNVLSATKLFTPRWINGYSFDGTADIGVDYRTQDFCNQANQILTGGGTISNSSTWDVKWSARFIVISSGRGTKTATGGYFDINMPPLDTAITGLGGAINRTVTANGIEIKAWESLYYILPVGQMSTSIADNFRIVSYTSNVEIPGHWIKICTYNGDAGYIEFANGTSLRNNSSINTALYDVLGADVQGPVASANKLATARTISITGDLSYSVNFDGSANATATATLANTGITAGAYTKITVDSKGRATAGTTLSATDIPALDTGKLTTGTLPVERGGTGVGTSTGTGSNVLNTAPTFSRVISVGTGNGFNSGAVELVGNGAANTIFPTIGFHQPTLYAGTIQLKGDGDFKFYKQNGDLGNVNASTGVFTTSVTAPTFTGNATSATGAKYQTRGTGATCAEKFTNTPAGSTSISECLETADAPNTGWWMIHSIRHVNSNNYWGVQMAYGWEDNPGLIYQRNVSAGNWSAWTRVDVSGANISELVNNVGYITTEGRAYPKRVGGGDINFNWSGQGGQPTWLWGGNNADSANMYVYNPSNFSVNYANTCYRANDLSNHQWNAGNQDNGYVRLSTGVIIQWGINKTGASSGTQYFPVGIGQAAYVAASAIHDANISDGNMAVTKVKSFNGSYFNWATGLEDGGNDVFNAAGLWFTYIVIGW